ncbi:MAG: hypothetical protein VB034_10530 [Eubacteriales bacterium]|nr:hypothetical protein [Eubacteriales bacterium]
MKPYLESLRRLSRVALILLVLCVAASMIVSLQYCTQENLSSIPSFRQMFFPVIVYMFVGGLVLAMDGFSFLNRRSESDFYHSLPVSRKQLFWAVMLAALTWFAATVLASVLVSVIVYTLSHTPFVPDYALVAVPFCIAGGMLVFAAASIAMSLTGTWLTNIALTAIILGLPRFVQFVVARGVISRFSMIDWLDLPWYLSPVTNVATGQIVAFTRKMLGTQLYHIGNAAYSLVVAAVELVVACLLFVRRPSEVAEHSAKNSKLQTFFACLLIFPIGILFASGAINISVTNLAIVLAAAVALYLIYQIIAIRNLKKAMCSLLWALIPTALAVGMYFGIKIPVNALKYDLPVIQNVSYIQFPGSNRNNGLVPYDEFCVSQVHFTEQELKEYVLTSLRENVNSIDAKGYAGGYTADGQYTSYEPVTVVLKDGRKISREVWFANSNTLNMLRDENTEYSQAIRSVPTQDSICYLQNFDAYNPKYQQYEPILQAYSDDIGKYGIVPSWTYSQHSDAEDYSLEDRQSYGALNIEGYVGDQRYIEYYDINRGTQTAAAAWMTWQNSHSTNEYFDLLKQMSDRSDSFVSSSEYLSCTFSIYNVPLANGTKQFKSFYFNRSIGEQSEYDIAIKPLANELIDIISRSQPTTDPNALCVYMNWGGRAYDENGQYIGKEVIAEQAASMGNAVASGSSIPFSSWGNVVYYASDGSPVYYASDGTIASMNPSYRTFSSEDAVRVVEILKEWQELQKKQNIYDDGTRDIGIDSTPNVAIYATPTPAP